MVRWTTPAKCDLKEIHDYIARDSKFYAQKVSQNIVSRSEKLNDFPEIGRIVPEIGDHNIREVFVYSYRLIYEISPNGVQILALVHSKRDFSSGNFDELRK
jgi:plasmid stabilization system protein ParE